MSITNDDQLDLDLPPPTIREGGCGHLPEVTVTLSYDGIVLRAVPCCRRCTLGYWDQAREDPRMTIEIVDTSQPPGGVLRGDRRALGAGE